MRDEDVELRIGVLGLFGASGEKGQGIPANDG
jgi:hypothetical protein